MISLLIIEFIFHIHIFLIGFSLLLPAIIDWSLQILSTYRSNKYKRIITGILFGIGTTFI